MCFSLNVFSQKTNLLDAYGGSSAVDSFNIIKGSYIQQILENKNCEYRHSHEHPTAAELQLMAVLVLQVDLLQV